MFLSLGRKKGGPVTFGGKQKGKIIEIRKIGTNLSPSIDKILVVDGLKHNLLSISQLCDNEYNVIFEKG